MKMGDFFNRLVKDFFTSESFWHNEVSDLLRLFPFLRNCPESNEHSHSRSRYYSLYPHAINTQNKAFAFLGSSISNYLDSEEESPANKPDSIDNLKSILSDMEKCKHYFSKASVVRRRVLLSRWNIAFITEQLNNQSEDKIARIRGITLLPDRIAKLLASNSRIDGLEITNSQLLILPETLEHLVNLKVLRISNTTLTYLPSAVIFLSNLEELDLANNNIKYIPCGLEKLTKLKRLNLAGNCIKALPSYKTFDGFLAKLKLKTDEILALQNTESKENSCVINYTLPQYWATRLGQQALDK